MSVHEITFDVTVTHDEMQTILAALSVYGGWKARHGLPAHSTDDLVDRLRDDTDRAVEDHCRQIGIAVEGDAYAWDGEGF